MMQIIVHMIEKWDDNHHTVIEMWCHCRFDSRESQEIFFKSRC